MKQLHKIIWLAVTEFRRWFSIKHILIIVFSIIFAGEYLIGKMSHLAQVTDTGLNWLEPFILVMSYSFYAMLIPLTFTVLLSDYPDRGTGGIFMMARMTRKTWFIGQLLFALMVGFFYLLLFLFAGMLWIGPAGVLSPHWSSYMTQLYQNYPELYAENGRLFLESQTISHGTPVTVYLICTALMLLYFLWIGQVLCLFQFLSLRRAGIIFCIFITVLGSVLVSCTDTLKWLLPFSHVIFGIHYYEFYAAPQFPLAYSFFYLGILNLILFFVNLKLTSSFSIGDKNE